MASEARNLEYDHPSTPKPRKEGVQLFGVHCSRLTDQLGPGRPCCKSPANPGAKAKILSGDSYVVPFWVVWHIIIPNSRIGHSQNGATEESPGREPAPCTLASQAYGA